MSYRYVGDLPRLRFVSRHVTRNLSHFRVISSSASQVGDDPQLRVCPWGHTERLLLRHVMQCRSNDGVSDTETPMSDALPKVLAVRTGRMMGIALS